MYSVQKIILFLRIKCSQTVNFLFLLAFWYTVQGAQFLKWCNLNKHKTSILLKYCSFWGQNSFMLINIIVKSIVKSIVYLHFWYRYWYWLYDNDTIRYFQYSIHPYSEYRQNYWDRTQYLDKGIQTALLTIAHCT